MNVLSLFDGMSCGQLALARAGVAVTNYYACEIDKYAIEVARNNYPDTIHVGDIATLTKRDLPHIDLIIGGSPCQGFSFAGKQLNFNDPRSKLFFEYVRLLKELKPKYFLLENVKMKKEYQDVISDQLGVTPIEINSNLVSAQNRRRLYWTNIDVRIKPVDLGVKLVDIIEDGVVDPDKSNCIDTNYAKGVNLKSHFEKHRGQLVFSMGKGGKNVIINESDIKNPASIYETRTTAGKNARRIARIAGLGDKTPRNSTNKQYQVRVDGKSNCVLATRSNLDFIIDRKSNYRKLTVTECERLQTLPDHYTTGVSDAQRYKMIGNGWTVDVIAHIFKNVSKLTKKL